MCELSRVLRHREQSGPGQSCNRGEAVTAIAAAELDTKLWLDTSEREPRRNLFKARFTAPGSVYCGPEGDRPIPRSAPFDRKDRR